MSTRTVVWYSQENAIRFKEERNALHDQVKQLTQQLSDQRAEMDGLLSERRRDALDGQAALDETNNLVVNQRAAMQRLVEALGSSTKALEFAKKDLEYLEQLIPSQTTRLHVEVADAALEQANAAIAAAEPFLEKP